MSRFASPSRAAGFLLVLLLAAGLWTPNGSVSSRPGPAGPSYLFLSSNTDDHLSLAEVSRRLASPDHRRYHALAGAILQQLGVRGAEVHDAVGDWSDGVENSLLVVLPGGGNSDALRCAAARFGLAAEQRAVLTFQADPTGPDVLAVIDLPGHDLAAVRRLLDRHGLRDRTILAGPAGSRVIVLDAGGRRAEALENAAKQSGGQWHATTGRAESLAGATRTLARQRYHEVLRAHQCSRPALDLASAPRPGR